MSLIKVDVEKCTRDGICIAVCPRRLLSLDPEGTPVMLPEAASYCIGCGHCVAVCPNGALDNSKNPLSDHDTIPEQYSRDPTRGALFLRSRRSIRCYKNEPVPRKQMLELLEIARFAPSGHNSQGISYVIVEGPDNLMRLREIIVEWMMEKVKSSPQLADYLNLPAMIEAHKKGEDRIFRNAPHLIVAHALPDVIYLVSTVLSLEYIELYAQELGMGTCWVAYAQLCAQEFPAFSQFLKIPEGRNITGILIAGYPKYKYRRLPTRNPLDVAWFEA